MYKVRGYPMKKENKNFLYNVIYQLLIYIFPLITVSYISRVLGATNIGIYSYTYSIVSCFMLVALLGINNYGNRAISRVRDDKDTMSYTFFSIYFLQIILSIVILIIYLIYILCFCTEYKLIFLLQIFHLISTVFDINWFYFGLEKFKLTVTRNLIIKIISTILIFIFVKEKGDLWIYTIIMSGSILLSQLYLISQLPKYIIFKKVRLKDIFKNLKGCIILFIPVLAYGIYRILDKTMLGRFSVTELGYFENAEKIINIPLAIITALGTVMLPHMSYVMKNKSDEYKKKIYDSMKLALLLATTMAIGLILISEDAATIIFGQGYYDSGIIMKLLSITIIASAWANVIRTQYLIPIGRDSVYIFSTIGGAIINFIINLILIPRLGAYGACVGTICAEWFVTIYQSIMTRKELEIGKYCKLLIEYIIKGTVLSSIAYLTTFYLKNIYLRFSLQVFIVIILCLLVYRKYIVYDFFGRKEKERC